MRCARPALCLLLPLFMFCTGCPGHPGDGQLQQSGGRDHYDELAAVLQDQDQFGKALAKLQAEYIDPPDTANGSPGGGDAQFGLSSRVEADRAGIVLHDRYNDRDYVLWGFELDPQEAGKDKLKVTADSSEGGGVRLEFQARQTTLSVKLLARWVDGRFLQVSREILLGGLDMTYDLPESGHRWRFDGPWLPYRMVPGELGPYGVVQDPQASGNWQTATYPFASMAPAVAAFDKKHGFLLASTDKAARDLSRVYDLAWRVDPKYGSGEQLGITYRYYDGVQDRFADPYLVSGLPIRDSIVLEPFEINAQSIDHTQVEAETREVIARLGELSRCFWFVPKPRPEVPPGSAVALQEWVNDPTKLPDMQRRAVGKWEAQLNEALLPDGRLGPTGATGIAARDLGGAGLAPQGVDVLKQLNAAGLPTLQYADPLHLTSGSPYSKLVEPWLERGADKQPLTRDAGHPAQLKLDVRLPAAAAWLLRKTVEDFKAAPEARGYALDGLVYAEQPSPSPAGDARLVSYPAAAALVMLQAAAELRTARADALLTGAGGLSLAQPAFCDVYANGDGAFGRSFGSGEPGSPEPALVLSNRLSNDVCVQVFGVHPWLTFGGRSFSGQVLATTPQVGGHAITRSFDDQEGFQAWSENLKGLRKTGGEVQILYAQPELAGYGTEAERPASFDKLITVQPAILSGQTVWVTFHGTGGSVAIDEYNNLTVSWEGGEWTGRLPGGIWKVDHPNPATVSPDDTVLIRQTPLTPGIQPGMAPS
jgi:hypothetical protein